MRYQPYSSADAAIQEFLYDHAYVSLSLTLNDILMYITSNFSPDDLYDADTLAGWAELHGYIKQEKTQ